MPSKILEYNKISCEYYDNEKELNVVEKLCNGFNNKKILEVGCGIGRLALLITKRGGIYFGIDNNQELIKYCKKKYKNLNFKKADAKKLPFKNEEFDIILYSWVLPGIKDILFVIKEGYRVLKLHGFFISVDGTFLGEYGRLIQEFFKIRKTHREFYFQKLRDYLVSVFRNIQHYQLANIPYVFPDKKLALKEIILELTELEKIKLKKNDKEKINKKLEAYQTNGKIVINETVAFHKAQKML